jgi:hypothetical protein
MRTFGIVILVILGIVALSIFGFMGTTCNNAQQQVQDHVVNNSFNSYEEFQEIYNTCQKLNSDLCNIKDIPETDKMFEQFSKAQRITSTKATLNRWIEEYNGKSKMWNRSLWKSKSLPYQLSATDFNCY